MFFKKVLKKSAVAIILFSVSCSQTPKKEQEIQVPPPQAQKIKHLLTAHGETRNDPYYWMSQRDSKAVLDHIAKENHYSQFILNKSQKQKNTIWEELKNRTWEEENSAPYKKGDYYYYHRYEKDKQYPFYCRKKGSLSAPEEIYLDVNQLAVGKKFFSLIELGTSPNNEILAFAVDENGRRFYNLKFKNLKTREILQDEIPNVVEEWVWANDNKTGFYIRQNPTTLRAEKVYRYTIGSAKSTEVYHEKDETFDIRLEKSLNEKTIFIQGGSYESNESLFVSADHPTNEFKVFYKREPRLHYHVTDGGDAFYILTNWKASNFRLMKTKSGSFSKKNWIEVVPHRQDVYIESFFVHKNFIVQSVRYNGLSTFEVVQKANGKPLRFDHKGRGPSTVLAEPLNEFNSHKVRYQTTSLIEPHATYDFDVNSKESQLLHMELVPNFESELYASERLWAKAKDGSLIPITVAYKKSSFKSGTNPLYIYAYGSYGLSSDPTFTLPEVSLMDRGFIYAIAHIRGGMEMGRDWYEKGRLFHKKNTFTDFIDATEYLLSAGYGRNGHVYMEGRSAGGLLVGTVLNMRSDLYHGAHAGVPFVDAVTTMLDDSIPLTTHEYDQWGNPHRKKDYDYIFSYSPYDNVKSQAYPNILVTTGFQDPQVQYFEPLKWAARLRENNKGNTHIIIKTDMDVGHFGVTGRYDMLGEYATELGYFVWLEEENK